MQKKIVSLAAPILIGIMALALGWFARAALPLSAQGIVMDGHATLSDPAAPSAPAGSEARLTYQGRLTNISGAPINTTVGVVFKLYDQANALLWTSATRGVTPVNGLFTVYLGDGADPELHSALFQAASIGVTVGGDAEMTPRQPLNSVVGHSATDTGVVGSSGSGIGALGSSDSWFGVIGESNSATGVFGFSRTGYGVFGITEVITRAAIVAQNLVSTGPALEIYSGTIKATGAGIGTSTFAFIQVSSITNIVGNRTLINNAITNGDAAAMLYVTHVNNPSGGCCNTNFNKWFGVIYDGAQWSIYLEDLSAFPANIAFNVMVIKR
jgi:hypothetical protein